MLCLKGEMGPQMEGVITKRMIGHKRIDKKTAGGMWLRVLEGTCAWAAVRSVITGTMQKQNGLWEAKGTSGKTRDLN